MTAHATTPVPDEFDLDVRTVSRRPVLGQQDQTDECPTLVTCSCLPMSECGPCEPPEPWPEPEPEPWPEPEPEPEPEPQEPDPKETQPK